MKVLVTGASQGIGEQICRQLSQRGDAITLVARSEGALQQLTAELGDQHDYLVADLSQPEGREKVTALLESGGYNLLVNNAGYGLEGAFTDYSVAQYDNMIDLNIKAVVELSHVFLRHASSGDALINISSVVGLMPMPNFSTYSATKGFVTFFSETLWAEYKSKNIFVMGLCPGITWTGFQERAGIDTSNVPGLIAQTPQQVAEVALRALDRRKQPSPVSGGINKVAALMGKLLPRKIQLSVMKRV